MNKIIIIVLLFCGLNGIAQIQKYYSSFPLRNGSKEALIELEELNGVKMMGMASCKRCPTAPYQYNKEASELSGTEVYGNSGIYMISYDKDSYVAVLPSQAVALGKGIWDNFLYVNFHSTNKAKAEAMTKEKIEKWTKELSSKLANK